MQNSNVRIITLGCAKNDVDSEEIAGVLSSAGYSVDGSVANPDVTIINTCGFLEAAKRESVQAIKDAVRDKKNGKTGRVIVAGCLAQRLGQELQELAPGADAYVGVGQMARFAEIVALPTPEEKPLRVHVDKPNHLWAEIGTRARVGAPWSAYLKVSEGCDHRCTFCTIPSFRGGHVSKPIERVLAEAQLLGKSGVREINLIAQDVTQYGYDLYKEFTMPKLLRELSKVEGIDWVRLLYCYPNRLTDEVIEAMATLPKICHYIDVPLQHTHPEMLRAMKRPWDGERYLRLTEKLRASMPDAAIRTTFIVGFPGETDAHFESLLVFIRAARLDKVGAFTYSQEPGTPSHDFENQVSKRVKQQRFDVLMRTQQEISLDVNKSWVGKSLDVLIEGVVNKDWSVGRSHRDAPEIDGLVYVEGEQKPGSIVSATIQQAEPYDLFGTAGHATSAKRRLTPLRQAMPVAPR